jgi:hypothetical protein
MSILQSIILLCPISFIVMAIADCYIYRRFTNASDVLSLALFCVFISIITFNAYNSAG